MAFQEVTFGTQIVVSVFIFIALQAFIEILPTFSSCELFLNTQSDV